MSVKYVRPNLIKNIEKTQVKKPKKTKETITIKEILISPLRTITGC